MNQNTQKSYVFLCSNATEQECFDRMLFGGTMNYKPKTDNIEIGDALFLYNYQSGFLHGKFVAVSKCSANIVPEAWGKKFPWQIKVKRVEDYDPISKTDIESIIQFRDFMPKVLNSSITQALDSIFKSDERKVHLGNAYRNKFSYKLTATDGHIVQSAPELVIDNWLFNHGIPHGYGRQVPIKEQMYCDFFIINSHNKNSVYMEYWGLEDEDYIKRKKEKLALYKKYNLDLIEINPGDIGAIDDILPQKLIPYLGDYKF